MWTAWGGLPVRTCSPVQSGPSDRSSIVGAHRRISRRRSVKYRQSAGEEIRTFFLALVASEMGKAGERVLFAR